MIVIPANLDVDITRKNTNVRQMSIESSHFSLYPNYIGSQFKTGLLVD